MTNGTLPDNWTAAALSDLCEVVMGQSPPSTTYNDRGDGLPFFQGKAEFTDLFPIARKWCSAPSKVAEADDILLSVRAPVGPTNVAPTRCCIGRGLAAIRPRCGIPYRYVLYGVRAGELALAGQGTGTTFDAVSGDQVRRFPLPLAPLPEQRRIVEKIEELFSMLDAGVAALERVRANLKRYRASVLKSAVEGRLTEEWRAKHPDTEPASVLLDRILQDRRRQWEEDQLAKFAGKGQKPPAGWQAKYKPPVPPDTSDQSQLPEGWCRTSIARVAECLDYRREPVSKEVRAKRPGDIPYYGANGLVGSIDDYLFDEALVLVVEDETFIGREKPFCYKIEGKSWVNNHAHVLRATDAVDADYLNYSLMHYPFVPLTQGTTARRKLTQASLMAAPYLLPPLAEQAEIVAEVERRLSVLDEIEMETEAGLKRAARLRQAILKRAFEGRLVPQDPNDEPASVLLERIKAERANETPSPRTRKKQ